MQQKEGITPEITYVITSIGPDPSSDFNTLNENH